jgi:hypothetical protein
LTVRVRGAPDAVQAAVDDARMMAKVHLFGWSALVPPLLVFNAVAHDARRPWGLPIHPLLMLFIPFVVPQVLARLSMRPMRKRLAASLGVSYDRVDAFGDSSTRTSTPLVLTMVAGLVFGAGLAWLGHALFVG